MVSPETLRKYSPFADLNEEDLRRIATITQESTHEYNTYLCYQGRPAKKLHVVVNGHVEMQADFDLEGLKRKPLSVRTVGEVCSWAALTKPYILTASMFCPVEVTVLEIDAVALREMLEQDHRLANEFYTSSWLLRSRGSRTRAGWNVGGIKS